MPNQSNSPFSPSDLKSLRLSLDLSHTDLAERLGVTPAYINQCERVEAAAGPEYQEGLLLLCGLTSPRGATKRHSFRTSTGQLFTRFWFSYPCIEAWKGQQGEESASDKAANHYDGEWPFQLATTDAE